MWMRIDYVSFNGLVEQTHLLCRLRAGLRVSAKVAPPTSTATPRPMPTIAPVERLFFSGSRNGCVPHVGALSPSTVARAAETSGSRLPVPTGTEDPGLAVFHATLNSCTAVLTALPAFETEAQ